MNDSDAYKFGSYLIRGIAATLGFPFGSVELDESIGKAAQEIRPISDIAKMHPQGAIFIAMLAGGWLAVKPNNKGGKKNVRKTRQQNVQDNRS
jgi:hypothetical protein